jgi:hypothetical protein
MTVRTRLVVAVLLALAMTGVAPASAAVDPREDVFSFGDAGFHGSTGGIRLNAPLVGMAATTTGRGYWLLARDGGIFSYGDAAFRGSTGGMRLHQPVVGMGGDPRGRGYWSVAGDGGIFSFGVPFHGSMGGRPLNAAVVGMAPTTTGNGYWLVANDGGIFSFGDARFAGSTGSIRLQQPIVGMAADPDGSGYWLVAADGGVFAFDARFHGSAVGFLPAGDEAVGIAAHPDGGYRIATRYGGVYAFGRAGFHGAGDVGRQVTGIVSTPSGNGYWLVARQPEPITSASPLRFDGLGAVRVGMTLDQASNAIGARLTVEPDSGPDPSQCGYTIPPGTYGIAFMVVDGRIARVDVANADVRTEAGIRLGSTERQVRAVYPGMRSQPHPYDQQGRYLVVDQPGPYALLFETHLGRVESFRSGFDGPVGYIEGCF